LPLFSENYFSRNDPVTQDKFAAAEGNVALPLRKVNDYTNHSGAHMLPLSRIADYQAGCRYIYKPWM